MDIYDKKGIQPMLIAEQKEPFDSPDCIFELKFDGIRCVAYFENGKKELRNKRDMKLDLLFPELNSIHEQVKGKCILDGELIVTIKGKPDFYEVQRRAILRDTFKIQLAAAKSPATFVAYDILYINDKQITDRPLIERKKLLEDTVIESERIALSRYIEEKGIELYNFVVEQNLEGIVAKEKGSKYYFGKRSKEWSKIKFLQDEDYVVCGYAFTNEGMNSLFLGQYCGGQLIYKGNVSLGVAGENFRKVLKHPKTSVSPFKDFKGSKNIRWLDEPYFVATINYMYKTKTGALRQPVFKGFRIDKSPLECNDINCI